MPGPFPNVLETLRDNYPCRDSQIKQLHVLLSSPSNSPAAVVLHGAEATGKSSICRDLLALTSVPYAIVRSRECVTGRHLLERTVSACIEAAERDDSIAVIRAPYARTESLSSLVSHLQRLLKDRPKFVLVFDGIDQQAEAPPTLLPALARLREFIPCITVVFIVTYPRQRFLHSSGVPHVNFPQYNREEAIQILSLNPIPIFERDDPEEPHDDLMNVTEDLQWLWTRFAAAVWDSLAKTAARNVVDARAAMDKLWPSFTKPVAEGTHGLRDFSRLMVTNRSLFQNEEPLDGTIVPSAVQKIQEEAGRAPGAFELSEHAKYLLCAAYLASHNPARTDPIYFMKASEKKRKRRKGGVTPGRPAKHRKISRRVLGPQMFSIERLSAILRAIHPQPEKFPSTDMHTQIAMLTGRRLLRCNRTPDVLQQNAKWAINVTEDGARAMGRDIGIEIDEYLAE